MAGLDLSDLLEGRKAELVTWSEVKRILRNRGKSEDEFYEAVYKLQQPPLNTQEQRRLRGLFELRAGEAVVYIGTNHLGYRLDTPTQTPTDGTPELKDRKVQSSDKEQRGFPEFTRGVPYKVVKDSVMCVSNGHVVVVVEDAEKKERHMGYVFFDPFAA